MAGQPFEARIKYCLILKAEQDLGPKHQDACLVEHILNLGLQVGIGIFGRLPVSASACIFHDREETSNADI
jgi:hypothetical protein